MKKAGQIVLFKFPQTDLTLGKLRPALLLAPLPSGRDDWLVCMISSQLAQAIVGVDEIVAAGDADFAQSGLRTASVIRLTRLAVVTDSILIGLLGEISSDRLTRLKRRLAEWIETS